MELEIIIGLLSLFIITAFTNVLKTLKKWGVFRDASFFYQKENV